ncbi:hypothetical protein E4U42_003074 [Claviceps africana]|uniref:D-lactate dehydrogenase n=1 Tax=Claviceps africana TaxID=83212 RepID=A0A8K0J9T4_9HYPO|nr:hypothetical protein E4U42_003074 [Claviceps africana]
MRLAVFSTKPYDKRYIEAAQAARAHDGLELVFHEASLTHDTASLAQDADAVCVFVNDSLGRDVIERLAGYGVRAILLRCAGYNNVHLETAQRHGIAVANVPSYSPEAVAEFAVALIQTLNRNTHRAYNRVREGNFALDGLLGHTLHGRTVGIVGTGRIGLATARIMRGFGCRVLASDPFPSPELEGVGTYTSLDALLPECDIVSLHCPLTDSTRHIINEDTIGRMKRGVMLVNTSRGGLIDTKAVIKALKTGQLGGLALDVYEGESALFYDDHSGHIIHDDVLMRLTTFHNVLVCGHQAFFTAEALTEIADCTLRNAEELADTGTCQNMLTEVVLKDGGALPVRNV